MLLPVIAGRSGTVAGCWWSCWCLLVPVGGVVGAGWWLELLMLLFMCEEWWVFPADDRFSDLRWSIFRMIDCPTINQKQNRLFDCSTINQNGRQSMNECSTINHRWSIVRQWIKIECSIVRQSIICSMYAVSAYARSIFIALLCHFYACECKIFSANTACIVCMHKNDIIMQWKLTAKIKIAWFCSLMMSWCCVDRSVIEIILLIRLYPDTNINVRSTSGPVLCQFLKIPPNVWWKSGRIWWK